MSAHTPGPWIHEGMGAVVAIIGGRPRQVAGAMGGAPQFGDPKTEPQTILLANADLIAAAPDLLAALEVAHSFAVAYVELYRLDLKLPASHPVHAESLQQIDAAIAKARGGK